MLTDHAHDGVEVVGQSHRRHLLALVKANQQRSRQPIFPPSAILVFNVTATSLLGGVEATKGLGSPRQSWRFIARGLVLPNTACAPAQVDAAGVEAGRHLDA